MDKNIDLLKNLRDKTGAGITDCKLALEEAAGDIDKAVEILRKKGIAKATKRSDREANEGIIKVLVSGDAKIGQIVEINAETDFVVRNEKFRDFTDKLLDLIEAKQPESLPELLILKMENISVKDTLDNLSGVIGEKLEIKRYDKLTSTGTVAGYAHAGGRVGVLVSLDKVQANTLAHDIAMQIAAAKPKYISPDHILAEEIAKEKEIYAEQLVKEGKPAKIINKIIEGKLNKYFAEVCLTEQEYIKDDSKRVGDILGEAKVENFIRYSL